MFVEVENWEFLPCLAQTETINGNTVSVGFVQVHLPVAYLVGWTSVRVFYTKQSMGRSIAFHFLSLISVLTGQNSVDAVQLALRQTNSIIEPFNI